MCSAHSEFLRVLLLVHRTHAHDAHLPHHYKVQAQLTPANSSVQDVPHARMSALEGKRL
jgi:hypothetical protein